jgi:hypothetical protein
MVSRVVQYGTLTVVALALLWFVPVRAAQEGGRGGRQGAPAASPAAAGAHPDLSGRWGGGGGGNAEVSVRLPDGTQQKFENYAAYDEAMARGKLDPKAVLVGRNTNYRHGNNDYSGKDEALMWRYFANPPLYKPEHWEKVQYNDGHGNTEDLSLWMCLPGGIPRIGPPSRIVQTPTDIVMLYNGANFLNGYDWRVVPTDGRSHHPVYSKDQTYMGDSIGHWEGDTLVVDIVGFNDSTWLGWPGWIHSADMRVVEKFRREGNQLHYDVTVYDPEMLLEPWVMDHRVLNLNPSTVYTEDPPCVEGDSAHIVSKMR